jgi:hypothetical protein
MRIDCMPARAHKRFSSTTRVLKLGKLHMSNGFMVLRYTEYCGKLLSLLINGKPNHHVLLPKLGAHACNGCLRYSGFYCRCWATKINCHAPADHTINPLMQALHSASRNGDILWTDFKSVTILDLARPARRSDIIIPWTGKDDCVAQISPSYYNVENSSLLPASSLLHSSTSQTIVIIHSPVLPLSPSAFRR